MALTSGARRSWLPFANSEFAQRLPNLFFFRRHPFRNVPKQWERPQDEADYQQLLEWEGFVTINNWQEHDLTRYPLINQDLAELEEHLLPIFWDFNQKAKHYQNNFYFYQWVFIIGAFATTVFAILTAFFQNQPVQITQRDIPAQVQTVPGADEAEPEQGQSTVTDTAGREFVIDTRWSDFSRGAATFLSWATLVISLLTTYSATMTSHGEPRKKWNNYRRLTEELRMTYFKFLAHIEPFNTTDRVDELRRRVLEIRRKEQDNNG
jgi:hypothetical protein